MRATAVRAARALLVALVIAAWPCRVAAQAPGASAAHHAIDGVVAIVGGHTPSATTDVVLRSDVELRAILAIAARSPDLPTLPQLPAELLAATLQEILGELVIAREATRLHAPEPTASQIERHRAELVRSVGGQERFERLIARHGVSLEEIDAIARRRAFVDTFLRANLEGSTLVSDARVEEAYREGDHPFADRPLDEVREPLRAWLATEALQRDVRRWVEVLRSRTPMRVVVPFAASADRAPAASTTAPERGGDGAR